MTFSGRDFFIQSLLFWNASSGSSQGSSASSSSLSGGVGVRASSAVFILPRTAARILEQTLQVQTSSSLRASSLDGPGRGEGGAGVEEVAETSPSAIVTTLGGGGLSLILSLMERSERGGELLVPRLVEGEGEVVRVGDGEGGGAGALSCGGCCGGGATVWQTTKGSASPSPKVHFLQSLGHPREPAVERVLPAAHDPLVADLLEDLVQALDSLVLDMFGLPKLPLRNSWSWSRVV